MFREGAKYAIPRVCGTQHYVRLLWEPTHIVAKTRSTIAIERGPTRIVASTLAIESIIPSLHFFVKNDVMGWTYYRFH